MKNDYLVQAFWNGQITGGTMETEREAYCYLSGLKTFCVGLEWIIQDANFETVSVSDGFEDARTKFLADYDADDEIVDDEITEKFCPICYHHNDEIEICGDCVEALEIGFIENTIEALRTEFGRIKQIVVSENAPNFKVYSQLLAQLNDIQAELDRRFIADDTQA